MVVKFVDRSKTRSAAINYLEVDNRNTLEPQPRSRSSPTNTANFGLSIRNDFYQSTIDKPNGDRQTDRQWAAETFYLKTIALISPAYLGTVTRLGFVGRRHFTFVASVCHALILFVCPTIWNVLQLAQLRRRSLLTGYTVLIV